MPKAWTREELIIVLNLYCGLPFGQLHKGNRVIIEIAEKLDRTPSSIAMKLVNFASLDPFHKARGVKGLSRVSAADREIWKEFREDGSEVALESERIIRNLARSLPITGKDYVEEYEDADQSFEGAQTEGIRLGSVRLLQSFFRRTVLASYESKCCITGNPVRALLVASHILPWKSFPAHRVNPANGLCLVAHFDRAFDRGLIAFDANGRLLLSSILKEYLPNTALQQEFFDREGRSLILPRRFQPDASFLEHHRKNVFIGSKHAIG